MGFANLNVATFKDLAAGTQSALISVAIVIGGLWTAFMFVTTRPDKKAAAELFAQGVLEVSVEGKQVDMDDEGGLYISAVANIKNTGNRTSYLDLSKKPPFKVSKIHFGDGAYGKRLGTIYARNVTEVATSAIASHGSDQFHVYVRVPEPGHYYVEFAAGLSETDLAIDPNLTKAEAADWWGATDVVVEQHQPINANLFYALALMQGRAAP
jgi:hypothetical protein